VTFGASTWRSSLAAPEGRPDPVARWSLVASFPFHLEGCEPGEMVRRRQRCQQSSRKITNWTSGDSRSSSRKRFFLKLPTDAITVVPPLRRFGHDLHFTTNYLSKVSAAGRPGSAEEGTAFVGGLLGANGQTKALRPAIAARDSELDRYVDRLWPSRTS